MNFLTIQQQYLSNWHDNFVNYVKHLLSVVATLEIQPQATDTDKQGFDALKLLLNSKDVHDVENDLANGVVRPFVLFGWFMLFWSF